MPACTEKPARLSGSAATPKAIRPDAFPAPRTGYATLPGIQPILTLLLIERRFSAIRLLGLLLSLYGLKLVVWQSLLRVAGLLCMTCCALMQKSITQAASQVLPLHYLVILTACLCLLPWQPGRRRSAPAGSFPCSSWVWSFQWLPSCGCIAGSAAATGSISPACSIASRW